ncbi:MAG: AMP-binding protein [Candidatus Latescibacterota bacterium]|nr:MAG: AMP-binding protein [Candidatus Latescibacterota bacterium]
MLVNEFLENTTRLYPDKVALICDKKRWSYSEIEDTANSFANALIACGLEKEDRVAIYLENSAESAISIFGILKASAVFVVINPQVKMKKLEYILNDCQVKILITNSKKINETKDIIDDCKNLTSVMITDYDDKKTSIPEFKNPAVLSYRNLLDQHPAKKPPTKCSDADLASLIYTSGSTGNPKGVMLTHLNMVTAANSVIEYLENSEDDIILDCLPLSFDYGLYQVLMAFKFGGTVVLERSFTYPYQILDLIIKEQITGFPLVPAIAAILLQLKNLDRFDFSNLRYITNTAQAFPPKHIFMLRKLMPHVRIYSMYGLTECKRVAYLHPSQIDIRPTSVGKAMPNTSVYIVDGNGEEITTPGQIGELVVRGKNIMRGYWNLPEETSNRLKRDTRTNETVLYTGDLFRKDEEGYLYFVSRKDDIIKTAGEMVSPKEVENIIYEIEDVMEVAVVGVEDEILGQAIKAVIALKEDSKQTKEDVTIHCSKHLENFMVPKHIEFRKELPKTSSGKIRKEDLAQ